MNKKFTILALSLMCCLMFVPSAMADSACTTGTMASYMASGFTCNINGVLDFSNFFYSATPAASAPGAAAVNVIVDSTDPDIGFNFQGSWNSANTADVFISFDVTGIGGNLISDILVDFLNVGPFAGGGHVKYTEQYCSTSGCFLYVDAPITDSTAKVVLGTPVSHLSISKDLQFQGADGGNCSGACSASMSAFGNQYSHTGVPEPRAVSLLLSLGLLVGFAIFKRNRVAQN